MKMGHGVAINKSSKKLYKNKTSEDDSAFKDKNLATDSRNQVKLKKIINNLKSLIK